MISWEYSPHVVGGLGKHVSELVPALSQIDLDQEPLSIDVLTLDHSAEFRQQQPELGTGLVAYERQSEYLTVYRVRRAIPNNEGPDDTYQNIIADNYVLVGAAQRLAQYQQYDIVHIHDWLTGEAGIVLKHAWKIPLVVTIHATEQGRHQGYLPNLLSCQIDHMEWRICYEAWHIIVCSEFMKTELSRQNGVPQDKITMIPNGINFNELHQLPDYQLQALRQRYVGQNEHLLFYVGRITHEKGPQILIRAMPYILAQMSDVYLLLAGKNGESLLPLAQDAGVAHAIKFLGYISDQERDVFYQATDTAIFPSLYEPFGIVALEAMALGCNLIASDVGGLGEVVQHMQNGLTIYPNDPASIAWAVRQILEDPLSARQRSIYAQQQVRSLYNWSRIADRTAQLYVDVSDVRRSTVW